MRAVAEDQISIVRSEAPKLLQLLRVTTYSSYEGETVESLLLFASQPVNYAWDGSTVERYYGWLETAEQVSHGFRHIPDGGISGFRSGLDFNLDGTRWSDQNLWDRLTSENLIGATVEYGALWVREWGDPLVDPVPQHTVLFRGEITNVPTYNMDRPLMRLSADAVERPLRWAKATNEQETSERDLGRTYPIPVGDAQRVPLVQRQVGWVTTLVDPMTDVYIGNVSVTDATGFPDSPAVVTLAIDTEFVVCQKVDGTTINVLARAQSVGSQTSINEFHLAGALTVEVTDTARFVASSVPITGIRQVYVLSELSGELVRLPKGLFGVNLADEQLDPGKSLAVVSFTSQQWAQVIALLNKQAEATTQPAFENPVNPVWNVAFQATGVLTGVGTNSDAILSPTEQRLQYSSGPDEGIVWWFSSDPELTGTEAIRFRIRFRLTISANASPPRDTVVQYRIQNMGGVTTVITTLATLTGGSSPLYGVIYQTDWLDCPPGTTVDDFVYTGGGTPSQFDPRVYLSLNQSDGRTDNFANVLENPTLVLETEPLPLTQTEQVGVTSAGAVGFNLSLFADVAGAATLSAPEPLGYFDAATGWTAVGTTAATEGGGGVRFTSDGSLAERGGALLGISPTFSIQDRQITFTVDFGTTAFSGFAPDNTAFKVELKSGASDGIEWGFPISVFADTSGVQRFTFDPIASGQNILSAQGTLDFAAVSQINVFVTATAAAVSTVLIYRDFETVPRAFNQHPVDVAQWFVEEDQGLTADPTTFAAAKANLPSDAQVAGDLINSGADIPAVLAQLGWAGRTNYVSAEEPSGTVIKAWNADTNGAFPAPVRRMDEFQELEISTRPLDERPNQFTILYDHSSEGDVFGGTTYSGLLVADSDTNDLSPSVPTSLISNAVQRIGERQADPLFFPLVDHQPTAVDVSAYYVRDSLQTNPRIFSMEVPIGDGYDLEPGDVVDFLAPWMTVPTAVKARVISVRFDPGAALMGLDLVEVP